MFLFIPIGSDKAIYGVPWFTVVTTAACVLVYLLGFGIDTTALLGYQSAHALSPNLLLYAYAHAGLTHLLGNMVFLWCIGINLEYRWGALPLAIVYLVGAVGSAMAFGFIHPGSTVPLVGASGAIAAAMGAFLVSLTKTRIRFWYFFLLFRVRTGTCQVPAYVVLPVWLLFELLGAYVEAHMGAAGVAHTAHVGGFALGLLGAGAFKLSGLERRVANQRGVDVWDDPDHWHSVEPPLDLPTKQPPRCSACGLVNPQQARCCRRCGLPLRAFTQR